MADRKQDSVIDSDKSHQPISSALPFQLSRFGLYPIYRLIYGNYR